MTDSTPEQPTLPPTPPPAAWPTPLDVPAPAKRRLSPIAAGLIGLAVGAGVIGGIWAITASSGSSTAGTFTLEGSFTLNEDATQYDGGCAGTGGYDDITEGASVTVYGAGGDVVATGALGDSTYAEYTCRFDIAVPDVPKGEKFYKVEVSHRGTLQLSAEEAENGELAASLG
jgi:hypothetical protein